MQEVVFTALIGVVTNIFTWYAARRKNLAEIQSSELDNVIKAVEFYEKRFEDVGQRWAEAMAEVNRMNELYKKAISELNALEIRFNKLANENRSLIDELKKYKQLNGKSQ